MITSQEFRANFPEFSSTSIYPASLVDFWLNAAYLFLNAGRWGNQLDIGAQLFAGHHISLGAKNIKEAQGSGVAGSNSGPIDSKEVDKVKISYNSSVASVKDAGHWNLSTYGTRFMWLVDMFGAGPIQIPARGKLLGQTFTKDSPSGQMTYDSTGAFFVGELERLDQTLHMPLAAVTWGRDIDLRSDVTVADEVSSYTVSSFASNGGLGQGQGIGTGKSWISKAANQIATTSVDIQKITNPLSVWGNELKYTVLELESAARLGRPVDQQKFEALQLKWQMDIDEQVYIGDPILNASGSTPVGGLLNHPLVSALGVVKNVATGVSGSPWFINKTPDEILADFNDMLVSVWTKSGWAVISNKVLLPPKQYGYIATQKVSNAGNMSILQYILNNNLYTKSEGKELDIKPCKWCTGTGAGGTIGVSAYDNTGSVDRAVVYSQDPKRVRFPLTSLARTPLQYDSIYHKSTYYGRLGAVEMVYPETVGYFDGI